LPDLLKILFHHPEPFIKIIKDRDIPYPLPHILLICAFIEHLIVELVSKSSDAFIPDVFQYYIPAASWSFERGGR